MGISAKAFSRFISYVNVNSSFGRLDFLGFPHLHPAEIPWSKPSELTDVSSQIPVVFYEFRSKRSPARINRCMHAYMHTPDSAGQLADLPCCPAPVAAN